MKKYIISAIALIVILAASYSFLNKNEETKQQSIQSLNIGGVVLNIEVADTDIERTQGLSGRDSIGEKEGLLFIFDKEGYYGFWMKDMKFPIDIVWIDKDKKITHIESEVSPETYPKVFNSSSLSLYVLEIPAGFLWRNNIQIGDFVAF